MLDPDTKGTVFAEVAAEVGALNFLRKAEVSQVVEERQFLAGYGPVQFDCNCVTGKRIDFQACVPVEGRDVSSNFQKKN